MPTSDRLPRVPLLLLAASIFLMVTSEFLPSGLLPDIASDLRVSVAQAGLLVTIFAATVVVSTTPLVAITRRVPRKWLLVSLLAIFALANVLAAVSDSYGTLVVARVLGGLIHGVFWSVVGPYTALIVPQRLLARGLAFSGAGGTAAFVFGVPLGTALGHAVGWRLAFVVLACAVVLVAVVIVAFLPHVDHRVTLATGEVAVPLRRDPTLLPVLLVGVVVLVVLAGQYTLYTYIAPWLIQRAGVASGGVSTALFVYGGAGAIGLVVVGLFGDRHPRAALIGCVAGIPVAVTLLAVGTASPPVVFVTLALWGVVAGGLPNVLQTRSLSAASPRLRDFSASLITSCFNAAIGSGALLGGLLIDAAGLAVLPWALVVIVLAGLLIACVITLRAPRRAAVAPAAN